MEIKTEIKNLMMYCYVFNLPCKIKITTYYDISHLISTENHSLFFKLKTKIFNESFRSVLVVNIYLSQNFTSPLHFRIRALPILIRHFPFGEAFGWSLVDEFLFEAHDSGQVMLWHHHQQWVAYKLDRREKIPNFFVFQTTSYVLTTNRKSISSRNQDAANWP